MDLSGEQIAALMERIAALMERKRQLVRDANEVVTAIDRFASLIFARLSAGELPVASWAMHRVSMVLSNVGAALTATIAHRYIS